MLAGAIIAIISAGSPCLAQNDDFDDNNDTGWTRFNPLGSAKFSTTVGTYHIIGPASPDPVNFGAARAASLRLDAVYSDFCVMVDIVAYNSSLPQAMGVMARVQGTPTPGTTAGYVFTYQPAANDVQISRVTAEQPTAVGAFVELPAVPSPGTTLRLVLWGYGSYLEGRIYDTADLLDPLAICFGTDTTYASGTCGLLASHFSTTSNEGIDATFDNYAANDGTPPPVSVTQDGTNGVTLSWPDSALCWQLQTSSSLAPGSWSDVTTGITHQSGDGTFSLAATFASGGTRRFWQWWLPE